MFSNISGKIKLLAVIVCILGMVFSMVLAMVYWILFEEVLRGFLWFILGPLLSWISCFVLYGFGQLVENSDEINAKISNDKKISSDTVLKKEEKKVEEIKPLPKLDYWVCKKCGDKNSNDRMFCKSCGQYK